MVFTSVKPGYFWYLREYFVRSDFLNVTEDERLAREAQFAQVRDQAVEVPVSDVLEGSTSQVAKGVADDLEKCISQELLQGYTDLCDHFEAFSKRVDAFVSNAPSRAFLRNLKVSTRPIQSVESQNSNEFHIFVDRYRDSRECGSVYWPKSHARQIHEDIAVPEGKLLVTQHADATESSERFHFSVRRRLPL